MPLGGHRILLVEDEAIIALDLKAIIHKANGEVVAYAACLTKALKLANTPRLSLAVLDFRLGSENSLPVARKLRAAGVPFIFCTGNVPVMSENWPDVPIISKPVHPAILISTLASLTIKRPSHVADFRAGVLTTPPGPRPEDTAPNPGKARHQLIADATEFKRRAQSL